MSVWQVHSKHIHHSFQGSEQSCSHEGNIFICVIWETGPWIAMKFVAVCDVGLGPRSNFHLILLTMYLYSNSHFQALLLNSMNMLNRVQCLSFFLRGTLQIMGSLNLGTFSLLSLFCGISLWQNLSMWPPLPTLEKGDTQHSWIFIQLFMLPSSLNILMHYLIDVIPLM